MVRQILFNGEMVRAILEGRKTVTRRVIKDTDESMYAGMCGLGPGLFDRNTGLRAKEPYYRLGDILYVRETWSKHPRMEKYYYRADSICDGHSTEWGCPERTEKTNNCELCEELDGYIKWKPSIHMPKEAARIWLKVTDVRAERLQDITEEQAKKEGISEEWACSWWKPTMNDPDSGGYPEYRKAFAWDLWDSTVKKPDISTYGWNANPWVWVIGFERCEKPEEAEG